MNTATATNCKARIDWRVDGRLGYSRWTLEELLRTFGESYSIQLYHAITFTTPAGEWRWNDDGRLWLPPIPDVYGDHWLSCTTLGEVAELIRESLAGKSMADIFAQT